VLPRRRLRFLRQATATRTWNARNFFSTCCCYTVAAIHIHAARTWSLPTETLTCRFNCTVRARSCLGVYRATRALSIHRQTRWPFSPPARLDSPFSPRERFSERNTGIFILRRSFPVSPSRTLLSPALLASARKGRAKGRDNALSASVRLLGNAPVPIWSLLVVPAPRSRSQMQMTHSAELKCPHLHVQPNLTTRKGRDDCHFRASSGVPSADSAWPLTDRPAIFSPSLPIPRFPVSLLFSSLLFHLRPIEFSVRASRHLR